MIHSLSGGVIKGEKTHRIVKVLTTAGERWYLCDEFAVSVSDKVIVPVGSGAETVEVVRVESVTETASPIPLKRAESVINIVFED